MSGNPIREKGDHRRLVLFSVLIFLAGLTVGVLLGVYGLRYFFFRRPPIPENFAKKAVSLIEKDFPLDASAQEIIEQECLLFFLDAERTFAGTRTAMEHSMREHAKNIAQVFPEGEVRQKWLANYRQYFPKGPPPRGAPPSPPPSSDKERILPRD